MTCTGSFRVFRLVALVLAQGSLLNSSFSRAFAGARGALPTNATRPRTRAAATANAHRRLQSGPSEPDSHPLLTITSPRSLRHRRIGRTSPRDHTQQTPHAIPGWARARRGARRHAHRSSRAAAGPLSHSHAARSVRTLITALSASHPSPGRSADRQGYHRMSIHSSTHTHTHTRINTHARTETGAEAPSQTITDQPARSRARARQEGETLWHRRPPHTPQRASAAGV